MSDLIGWGLAIIAGLVSLLFLKGKWKKEGRTEAVTKQKETDDAFVQEFKGIEADVARQSDRELDDSLRHNPTKPESRPGNLERSMLHGRTTGDGKSG